MSFCSAQKKILFVVPDQNSAALFCLRFAHAKAHATDPAPTKVSRQLSHKSHLVDSVDAWEAQGSQELRGVKSRL